MPQPGIGGQTGKYALRAEDLLPPISSKAIDTMFLNNLRATSMHSVHIFQSVSGGAGRGLRYRILFHRCTKTFFWQEIPSQVLHVGFVKHDDEKGHDMKGF